MPSANTNRRSRTQIAAIGRVSDVGTGRPDRSRNGPGYDLSRNSNALQESRTAAHLTIAATMRPRLASTGAKCTLLSRLSAQLKPVRRRSAHHAQARSAWRPHMAVGSTPSMIHSRSAPGWSPKWALRTNLSIFA